VRLSFGPHENRHRPAIDPLFRSAAISHAQNVIGVILTGSLGDGAAGLQAVQQCGGITVVQAPEDASFPGMPRRALELNHPDHVVPLAEIPSLLARLVRESPPKPPKKIPPHLKEEAAVEEMSKPIADMSRLGKPSQFACPDCHGVLWEITDSGNNRHRCRSGHAYSLQGLDEGLTDAAEDALWIALRAMEEKLSILDKLAVHARNRKLQSSAQHFTRRISELTPAVTTLRSLVQKLREKR
jgi:two-component system chemotaxis response regulator CheB